MHRWQGIETMTPEELAKIGVPAKGEAFWGERTSKGVDEGFAKGGTKGSGLWEDEEGYGG